MLLESLRGAQAALAAESDRARLATDEAESLGRRVTLLDGETVSLRATAARREAQHQKEVAEVGRGAIYCSDATACLGVLGWVGLVWVWFQGEGWRRGEDGGGGRCRWPPLARYGVKKAKKQVLKKRSGG